VQQKNQKQVNGHNKHEDHHHDEDNDDDDDDASSVDGNSDGGDSGRVNRVTVGTMNSDGSVEWSERVSRVMQE